MMVYFRLSMRLAQFRFGPLLRPLFFSTMRLLEPPISSIADDVRDDTFIIVALVVARFIIIIVDRTR